LAVSHKIIQEPKGLAEVLGEAFGSVCFFAMCFFAVTLGLSASQSQGLLSDRAALVLSNGRNVEEARRALVSFWLGANGRPIFQGFVNSGK